MLFLTPNQKRQSIEGLYYKMMQKSQPLADVSQAPNIYIVCRSSNFENKGHHLAFWLVL